MRRFWLILLIFLLVILASTIGCWSCASSGNFSLSSVISSITKSSREMVSPLAELITQPTPKPLPLLQYTIGNLQQREYQSSQIILSELVEEDEQKSSYLFSYQTMNKKMTGLAMVPVNCQTQVCPVVILIRGYAEPDYYSPGFGTKNASGVFANNGYVTLAIDFFGFASADAEPENSWEARFLKPINIIELIKTIQKDPYLYLANNNNDQEEITNSTISKIAQLNPEQIKIWSHSNGGQIAISVLQILEEPIPTTSWAPVLAPFPYSILFFSRTSDDEGKEARAWLAIFEKDYDVFEFSITQHLEHLNAPLQIHHGTADNDALKVWSDSFVRMVDAHNEDRQENEQEPIEYNYFSYPGADHNLQPAHNWNQAIQRDLDFFEKH